MKIAILVSSLSGGGAERVASLWINGFAGRGHSVIVILNSTKESIPYKVPDCIEMFNISLATHKRCLSLLLYPARIIKLRVILKKTKPDVLITVLHPLGLFALLASVGMKHKIINTEHNPFERPQNNRLSLWEYFCKFVINRRFDAVTVLTHVDKNIINDRLKNVYVLPNPLTPFESVGVKHSKNIVAAAGRLNAWYVKGFDVLVEAWSEISIKYPNWRLQIAGTGTEDSVQFIERLIRERHCEKSVQLVGFQADMSGFLSQSDIFVLSSRYEGFGMVLLEAMSQGCACIACDYNGRQKEIISDSSYGVLCPPDSIKSLVQALSLLIEDSQYRQCVQANSPLRANDFSLEKIMNEWEEILDSLL